MKHVFFFLLFFLTVSYSFAQFSDTSELNAYIKDTIKDRRPSKVTAAQLQKSLLGIVKFIPINTALNSMQVGYGSSTNILKGNSAFTFNDITNTLYSDSLLSKRINVINTIGGTEYTRINYNTLNMVHNSGSDNVINLTTNSNSFKRITVTNTNPGISAGAGSLYINDLGATLQYYVGSSTNAFVPNGAIFRTTAAGGLNIVADAGPIAFGKNASMGANEFARFTTNGRLGIGTKTPEQKLHIAGQIKIDTISTGSSTDSILTTSNGLIKKIASDALGGSYSFSTGLTDASGTITNNLSTGISGGQTVVGGTAGNENLTLSSTTHASKGKIVLGASVYDETSDQLGIGVSTPSAGLHLKAGTATAGTAPLKLTSGTLLTTPEAGAIEYDGTGYFFTDAAGVRRNLTQTDRVFKIYPWDYHTDTLDFEMYGWNAEYVSDPTYAPSILATIDVEITVTSGTPAGTVISATFEGQTVYTLTVTGTAATDYYVIGSIRINQDIKYPYIYYIKGAAETIDGTGLVSTTNTAYRFTSDSFINPMIEFGTTSSSLARIGCTYTVDKKQQGRWIYYHGPGGGAGTF